MLTLRDFLAQLEAAGELRRVSSEVSPRLEMTEICDRTLRAGGPALLFERPTGSIIPVLGNLIRHGASRRLGEWVRAMSLRCATSANCWQR